MTDLELAHQALEQANAEIGRLRAENAELQTEQVQKTLRGLKRGAAKLGMKTRGDFF